MEQKKRMKINNNHELFDLCWELGIQPTEESWTSVRHFLHDTIEDKERIQELLCYEGRKNQTTLHLILTINNPPMDIVTMLVELAPETLQMKDAYGSLPLHVASSNRVSLEMLTFILHAYRESAQVVDNEGNLPLHLACFFRTSLLDKVNLLIQAYPKGKDIRNLDSSTQSDILREQAFIRRG
jgi:ankyrin repeat protein